MSFTVDKQTLDDLDLVGRFKAGSIFQVFDRTHTRGGSQLLESMFLHPLSDAEAINTRSSIFQYFQTRAAIFPVDKQQCDEVEEYISGAASRTLPGSALNIGSKKLLQLIGSDQQYELIHSGIQSLIRWLHTLHGFFDQLSSGLHEYPYRETIEEIRIIFRNTGLKKLMAEQRDAPLPIGKIIQYDRLLRHSHQQDIRRIMEVLYEIDVYITVSSIAEERGLACALAVPFTDGENRIDIVSLYHPQVTGAISNNIRVDHERNLIFLTGANMAGKSTFMKAFGTAIYLAHMGFPVAAAGMTFSVQDGLYTSINVSDNLNMGYSHFYAEVLRVRRAAEEVSLGKNLVIIFDELFKGTNVKDAYDATVAVTEAFANNRNCTFMVSTHIVEAGQTLQQRCHNMVFTQFPTVMENGRPAYTYKLQPGISSDRHGMRIITEEGILEIIRGRSEEQDHR